MPAGNADSHWIVILVIALIALATIAAVLAIVKRVGRRRGSGSRSQRGR